jgi:integrase
VRKISYRSKNTPYEKFSRSIHTDRTRESYKYALKDFEFCKLKDYADLLRYSDDERYNAIQDFIQYQVQDRNLSFSTVNISNSAIKLFFGVNGKEIRNWKELSRQKGKRKRVIKDRIYTLDELKRLLEYADIREKVIILTLLTTGMRITALAEMRIGDIKTYYC